MTNAQFLEAVKLAGVEHEEFDNDILSMFVGCGLKGFGPVYVTLADVAELIRYQCSWMFHKGFDQEALQEIADIGRRKFLIVPS